MKYNESFDDVNDALPTLLTWTMHGDEVGSRAGRTMEIQHLGVTLEKPWQREVLLPSRKANLAAQIAESMWVLSGGQDIGWLSHYLPRAADFSDDGATWRAAYGKRIRAWERRERGDYIDQLHWVVDLLKADPLSRRAVITIYDPDKDSKDGKDIPCNNWLSFSSRLGKLDLHVAVRSNDAIWGWSGINVFEWSVLQEIVAGLLGIEIGSLHFSVTSFHVYEKHWSKATTISLDRQLWYRDESPRFDATVVGRDLDRFDNLMHEWFEIEKGIRNGEPARGTINAFPEPMLRSWLRVIEWWWTGDQTALDSLQGSRLHAAAGVAMQPPSREPEPEPEPTRYCLVCGASEENHAPGGSRYSDNHSFTPPNPPLLAASGETVRETWPVLSYPPGAEVKIHQGAQPSLSSQSRATHGGHVYSRFIDQAINLHNEKHVAYGDSWKRRGEMLGIMANIARKIDRLGQNTSDETSADTAVDLMVYLAKYRWWLVDRQTAEMPASSSDVTNDILGDWSDDAQPVNDLLMVKDRVYDETFDQTAPPADTELLEKELTDNFMLLENQVKAGSEERYKIVDVMLKDAYELARVLWKREQAEQWKLGNATRKWNPDQSNDDDRAKGEPY